MAIIKSNVKDVFGTYRRFEFVDLIELEGAKYALLLPLLAHGVAQEVVILAIDERLSDSVTGSYASVTDNEVLTRVYAVFAQRNETLL